MVNASLTGKTDIDKKIIFNWISKIRDPEIPVISISDLGILRGIELNHDKNNELHCTVIITPTYSGCPAMKVISEEIIKTINDHGITHVDIKMQLSPAWTTDWISQDAKIQLKNYGISPPNQQAIDISNIKRKQNLSPKVSCPKCNSFKTICISQFSSTACKSLYRCNDCLEPFDYFKAH